MKEDHMTASFGAFSDTKYVRFLCWKSRKSM